MGFYQIYGVLKLEIMSKFKNGNLFCIKWFVGIVIASILLYGIGYVTAKPEINEPTVQVDGKVIDFDVKPMIKNNRTLVPFRQILETMGATVNLNGDTQTVVCNKGNTQIKLTISDTTAYVNGMVINLDVPAAIINCRTFVPLRFISESLDCKVDWNEDTATVLITTTQKNSNEKIGRFGAKFEPADPNAIYSGAGQGKHLPMLKMTKSGDPNRKPFLINVYQELTVNPTRIAGEVLNLQNSFPGAKIILGMAFPQNNPEELAKVSDGTYDAAIHNYATACKNLGNDIFLRIGFEFGRKGNNYSSDSYKPAFRHIVDIFRSEGVNNVAFVWCAVNSKLTNMFDWYPGDEYVDWFSFDSFGIGEFDAAWFKEQADAHSKPILIGESSRSSTKVTLEDYFNNFFSNVKNPDYGIRGFQNINWDWSLLPKWTNWGTLFIQTSLYL